MNSARCAIYALIVPMSVASAALAAEEPPVSAMQLFLESNHDALKRLAADYLSARVDSLDIKYIEPSDTNTDGGFAVGYQWDLQRSQPSFNTESGEVRLRSLDYSLAIEGTYAFSDADNNQDLSTVRAAAQLTGGNFGKPNYISKEATAALLACLAETDDPTDPNDDAAWAEKQAHDDACWVEHGIADIVRGDQRGYYYWLDFHGALEGNQDYSSRHVVAGVSAALAYQLDGKNARYNVLDWPFAGLRRAFGDSRAFVAPLPSLALAVEQIDATNDIARMALTNDAKYTRGSAEVAFQSRVATIGGRPIRFNASYRYFHEFSPPDAVRAAGFDSFGYTKATLRFPALLLSSFASDQYEFFVSYTNGQLPFDQRSDAALEVGIATNIQWLGRLLSR